MTALKAKPLPPIERRHIESMLSLYSGFMQVIVQHYEQPPIAFDNIIGIGGALGLVACLRMGIEADQIARELTYKTVSKDEIKNRLVEAKRGNNL